jgi:hypothetical protein
MLDPFPLEDRQKIQVALVDVWKGTCESLGEKAVDYCRRIETALQKE